MIDTHCHIDLYNNPLEVAKECERIGIVTIGMTNIPSHFEMGYPHLKSFKKVRLALGMHPLYAEFHSKELPIFHKNSSVTSYIGEVGLDFSIEGISTKEIQVATFKEILKSVKDQNKILSVHSRKAENEVLNLLLEYKIQNVIFHWYTGPISLIDKIVKAGYYFSINPAMIKSKNGQKIINKIPHEFILTESDGPFIQVNGNTIKPKDVYLVHEYLSKKLDLNIEVVAKIIESNFNNLINRLKNK